MEFLLIMFVIAAISIGTGIAGLGSNPQNERKTINNTAIGYPNNRGERRTAQQLNLIKGHKHIINNTMINDNGKIRQIDHIAITEYGVFVVETKEFSGKIYGKEKSNEWTQYLRGQGYKFQNPIYQNFGHIEIIKKILKNETDKIYSIISFAGTGELKVEIEQVMHVDKIEKYIERKEKILKAEQIDTIYNIITKNQVTNEEYIRDQAYNAKQYVKYKNEQIEKGICPRCKGKLVKRKGKYGEFYGCSNYPKCRYTTEKTLQKNN